MDDTTRKMLVTIGAGIIKKALVAGGTALATHGIIASNQTETFVAVGMALVGAAWSFWNDYGRAIVLSKLEVLKATSLAQAEQARKAGLPPVTVGAIADKSPTLTPTDVAKVVTKLLIAVFVCSLFLAGAPAMAQTKKPAASGPVFTGDLGADIKSGFKGDPANGVQLTGDLKKDAQAVWDKIVAASNVDLKYASQLASNANTPASLVRKQCWDEILATNEQANGLNLKNADGSLVPQPDPKLFTQIEQAAEVIDALSPQGKLYTSCAGAAELAKANVIQFISAAVTGAAGLAKLSPIPGL